MAESSCRVIDLGGTSSDSGAPNDEESLGAIVARTYVVGRILGKRRPHISQIHSQMLNVWYIKGDFRIIPKPNNIFLFGFEFEEDKKKVLKGSPWLDSNMHLRLKGWIPDMILSQETARREHTGIMNTVAELVTELHDASPIHASASKPSWKRLAWHQRQYISRRRWSWYKLLRGKRKPRSQKREGEPPQAGEPAILLEAPPISVV